MFSSTQRTRDEEDATNANRFLPNAAPLPKPRAAAAGPVVLSAPSSSQQRESAIDAAARRQRWEQDEAERARRCAAVRRAKRRAATNRSIRSFVCCFCIFIVFFALTALTRHSRHEALHGDDGSIVTRHVVTSVDDDGPGTLREALRAANRESTRDAIVFEIARNHNGLSAHDQVVIHLRSRLPPVREPLVLDGANYRDEHDRVVLEGSTTDIECLEASGAEVVGSLDAYIPLLLLSNDDDDDGGNPSNSIVRNLVLRNDHATKSDRENARGPCTGVWLERVSNVTIERCAFDGFVLGPAALVALSTRTSRFVDNYFDNVLGCTLQVLSLANRLEANRCLGASVRNERRIVASPLGSVGHTSLASAFERRADNRVEHFDVAELDVLALYPSLERERLLGSSGASLLQLAALRGLALDMTSGGGSVSIRLAGEHSRVAYLSSTLVNATRIGIDLADNHVNPLLASEHHHHRQSLVDENDVNDLDFGPNGRQNSPRIDEAHVNAHASHVRGALYSSPRRRYLLQFFVNLDPSPSAHYLLGSTIVSTNDLGRADYDFHCSSHGSLERCESSLGTLFHAHSKDPQAPLYVSASATRLGIEGLAVACRPLDDIFVGDALQSSLRESLRDGGRDDLEHALSAMMGSNHSALSRVEHALDALSTAINEVATSESSSSRLRAVCDSSNTLAVCIRSRVEASCVVHDDGSEPSVRCPGADERAECPSATSELSTSRRANAATSGSEPRARPPLRALARAAVNRPLAATLFTLLAALLHCRVST